MWLNEIWFVLIAVLWIGFFVLDGFDFGVGALLRVVGKDERGRRVLINTIGPVWDGNEVWLLTAGGATFAAFPQWYATLFSGFYLPLLLILVCLIVRGVAFEYRVKGTTDLWRRNWDWAIQTCSIVTPLLLGVAFGNMVEGVPLDANHEYVGGFFNLLNPFALLTGITLLVICVTHGAVFLALKTRGEVRDRAKALALKVGAAAVLLLVADAIWQLSIRGNLTAAAVAAVAVLSLAGGWLATRAGRDGWAFVGTAGSILALVAGWFVSLHPDVMPSNLDPGYSLNLTNAASSHYTLTVMSWVALCLVPFVVAYQAWSYWVFRKRISTANIPLPTADPALTGLR
ncbi:cytochrome d ubiquinol oxidase subunit II [Nakamurella sp. UYEF19]|uniref:cytochrome d ubiquinol oxidase subunit II n=1 Tax=Nakamurella sp. UYEF19 TaxID=1756392 RepID=UPI00339AB60B